MSSINDQQAAVPTLPYRALTPSQQRVVMKLAKPGTKLVLTRLSFTHTYWRMDYVANGERSTIENVHAPTAERLRDTGWLILESNEYHHSTYYVKVYVLNPLAITPAPEVQQL